MRDILRQNNLDLLRDLERLKETLHKEAMSIPPEMDTYYKWAQAQCKIYQKKAEHYLQILSIGPDTILSDVLSKTQVLTRNFNVFNTRLVAPVLRARHSDRLCLKLLQWLHRTHKRTQQFPVAVSDGEFACWPTPEWPIIYFMPSSAQHRLLYLPLFFHEFGHLLYACHKPEMDALVKELQEELAYALKPLIQRNDYHAKLEGQKRNSIVVTWYEWTQEFYCDAVGFTIGGPAFLHAFSMYFRMLGREEFHLGEDELRGKQHPVAWLRIKILADRARQDGFKDEAKELERTWQQIADAMDITEEHYGFYVPTFLPLIQQAIDDMLVETEPVPFEPTGLANAQGIAALQKPTSLLNEAWKEFLTHPQNYNRWEQAAIATFIEADFALSV